MKYCLLLVSSFISLSSIAQQTVDRKIGQRHDEYINGAWVGQDSARFLYNAFGNENRIFGKQGQMGSWINHFQTSTTYDANQNIRTTERENWTNGSWQKLTKYLYQYNSAGKRTEIIYQIWNTTSNSWRNNGRIVNAYNSNQSLTKRETYNWNGSAWQVSTQQDLTYSSSNELIRHDFYIFSNGVFEKQERRDYQYSFGLVSNYTRYLPNGLGDWFIKSRELSLINGSANPPYNTLKRIQTRDTLNSIWVDSLRITYSHSTSGLLLQTESDKYNPSNSIWTSLSRSQYDYNPSDQLIEEKNETYQSSSSSFQNSTRRVLTYSNNLVDKTINYINDGNNGWKTSTSSDFTYNSNDSLIYQLNQNVSTSTAVPTNQYFYHYQEVPVGLRDNFKLLTKAILYPNPNDGILRIQTDEKLDRELQISIYNLEGKIVWSQITTKPLQDLQINTSDLTSGSYFLELQEISSGNKQQFQFVNQ